MSNTDLPEHDSSAPPSSQSGEEASSSAPQHKRNRPRRRRGKGAAAGAGTPAAQGAQPRAQGAAAGPSADGRKKSGPGGRSRRKRGDAISQTAARKGAAFDPEGSYSGASFEEEDSARDIGLGDFDPSQISEAFRSLGLAPELLRAIHGMGFAEPTPIQIEAIPLILAGRDVIGSAQTGTGKTAAFALPTLHRLMGGSGTRTLALTPTRELAVQVADHFRLLGRHLPLRTAVIYGGVDYEPQFRALEQGVDVIVATPGRLLDHMKRKTANFSALRVLILDEADRMLDMGFAEEIQEILQRLPRQRQTLLFSATIPTTIEELAGKALSSPIRIRVDPPATPAEGIFHGVYPISASNKPRSVACILAQADATTVLIFTRTKAGADHLSDLLEAGGIPVARIHSDRSQRQREKALTGFREGLHRVLVATDIVARGIDVTDISHVINYDVPEYPEDYVHRAGRTARAGRVGYALTLMSPSEIMLVKNIERFIGKALPRVGLPGLQEDIHQRNLGGEPLPLKDQPPVARYDRMRNMPRRSGLSLR
ncbi:MAG: DEAD/DEAH box helicase [Nitrospinota bacterium]